MPNTNPCPTCHAQLDPGTPHTFCARTKEPKARELATRIAAMEANFDLLHRLTVDKREKDSLASKMDNLFGGGIDLATRLEALERAKENTGAARGDGSERQPSDSHGQHEEPGRSDPLVEGQRSSAPVAVDPYKLTDDQRALLAYAVAIRCTNHVSGYDSLADHVESLVTRAVRDTIQHGGGLERNATPREGRCPSPAASALPMPERPAMLDAAFDAGQVQAHPYRATAQAEEERLYALSLESRLARMSMLEHRDDMLREVETALGCDPEHNAIDQARDLQADRNAMGVRIVTLNDDRDALKAKLAEASEERSKAVLALEGAWGHQKNLEATLARVEKSFAEELRIKLTKEQADREAQRARAEKAEKRIADLESDRDALKAKLAEAVAVAGDAIGTDPTQRSTGCVDALAGHYRIVCEDRDALRAKLDGVREAAETWTLDDHAKDEYMKGRTVEDSLNAIGRAAITSALAAAENTGDAGRTPAGQCSTDRSTDGQPPTSTEPAVDEPGPVTNPAVSHPSTAPAFEMTFEQRTQLYSFLGMSTLGSRRERESLAAFVTDLVRSELRKAREGWVTREVAERALEQCALEYISGSSVHANAKDYLTAAIRAASKEASDGTR